MSRAVSDPAQLLRRPDTPGGSGHSAPGAAKPDASVCGDFGIRIARDGTWFYHGSPIGRKQLVKLFAKVLRRDEAGQYWLITPVERGTIVVDDAPFIAVELSMTGTGKEQRLTLRTNLDDEVTVDRAHPIRVVENTDTGEPSPYVLVRDNLEALIARAVFYQLVDLGVEESGRFGVWSSGTFFTLGELS
jgi:uncharacterized protein